MEILLRLRVLIWVLVLCLWGVMVYQFLGEEEAEQPRMQTIANPFKGLPLPEPGPEPPVQPPPPEPPQTLAQNPAAQSPAPNAALLPPGAAVPPQPSSLDYIKPIVPEKPPPAAPPRKAHRRMRRETPVARPEATVPPGFAKTETRHFSVYSEGYPASDEFLRLLENLHGNLMLDLAAFSPWASGERVTVFLFTSQDTYLQVTGRPAWSGGASSVAKRRVYVYESDELPGILAHELCHIYYDGFYLDGKTDPLWLSEGMATLIQVERGMAAPNWLRENMQILERGGGFSMTELMAVTTTSGASDDKVRLWYAQSYSIVRFLIRSQYRGNFYKFSDYIREGKDSTQALYRAYGMPYNRLKALEYAWRYELANASMRRLSASER